MILERREILRRLIAAGRLVEDAGLIEQVVIDPVGVLGGLLTLADQLRGEPGAALAAWRQRTREPFGAKLELAISIDVDAPGGS